MTDEVFYTKYVIRRHSELKSLNPSEHITEMTELLVQFLKQLTMVVGSDVLDEIWDTIDDGGKGKVSFHEFVFWATEYDIDLHTDLETSVQEDDSRNCKRSEFQEGVNIVRKEGKAAEFAGKMLVISWVSKQPGAAGKPCNTSMLTERYQINAVSATPLGEETADLAEAEKRMTSLKDVTGRRQEQLCSCDINSRESREILCEQVASVNRRHAGPPERDRD